MNDCVYIYLDNENKRCYVGQSNNMGRRHYEHLSDDEFYALVKPKVLAFGLSKNQKDFVEALVYEKFMRLGYEMLNKHHPNRKVLEKFKDKADLCPICKEIGCGFSSSDIDAMLLDYKNKTAEYKKEYYEANKDKIFEYNKEYREVNKDKIFEYNKEYREVNKDKIFEYNKEYYEVNKDEIIKHNKKYYEVNKDKILEYNKKYYEVNKDKILEYNKEYYEANRDLITAKSRLKYRYNKFNEEFDFDVDEFIKKCLK